MPKPIEDVLHGLTIDSLNHHSWFETGTISRGSGFNAGYLGSAASPGPSFNAGYLGSAASQEPLI
jgi:hypothetical protein